MGCGQNTTLAFHRKDPDWKDKFHVWRMDWDEKEIKLYVDDELLNEVALSETVNGSFRTAYKSVYKTALHNSQPCDGRRCRR